MAKTYYCKIKGKTYGPMTLEQLKTGALKGHLKPSDKVSPTFPTEVWLEAGSISSLNEIYKALHNNSDSDVSNKWLEAGGVAFLNPDYIPQTVSSDSDAVGVTDGVAINEENHVDYSQGINLNSLEKNSIEIVRLLKIIKEWVTFMGIVLVIYIILCIVLAVLMNPTLSHR
jgi:hypothetical protein